MKTQTVSPRIHRKSPVHLHRGAAVAAFILAAALLATLIAAPAGAHAPKEVTLSYDRAKQTLEVRISHSSKDPAAHYIGKVELKKNGKTISTVEYRNQPPQDSFLYSYPLEVAPGDTVEVKASCNIFGSKTVKLD